MWSEFLNSFSWCSRVIILGGTRSPFEPYLWWALSLWLVHYDLLINQLLNNIITLRQTLSLLPEDAALLKLGLVIKAYASSQWVILEKISLFCVLDHVTQFLSSHWLVYLNTPRPIGCPKKQIRFASVIMEKKAGPASIYIQLDSLFKQDLPWILAKTWISDKPSIF